jgi:hypothetical protein
MKVPNRILVPFLFALLFTGCASTPRPGTGDISFRLHWKGDEDLDLHVEEPSGEAIYFMHRKTESGGELDVDCNSAPDRICRTAIENVYWPVGKAAEGSYIYWVEMFEHPEAQPAVPFTLEVLLGKKVVHKETGTVSLATQSSGKFQFRFQRPPGLRRS